MTVMLEYDGATSRRIEAVYTTPDIVAQRAATLALLSPRPDERALDVGVGPGFLASDIAAAVGPGGLVCGIDPSDSMLELARARDHRPGSAPVELRVGSAVRIPCPDASFDLAVSTQVLEYVTDIPAALAELWRVLRPGGRVLVLDTDWDSIVWRSGDDARMTRVLAVWAEHLADPYLPRSLAGSLRRAGFAVATPTVLPLLNAGFAERSFSAGLIGIIAAFVTGRGGLGPAEVREWGEDLRAQGDDAFFSLNRYVFQATRPV